MFGRKFRPALIDATRIRDGRLVYIKRVRSGGDELAIARFFSESPQCNDPANHCVPILEVFADFWEPETSFIVMPYLRPFDDPPFGAIGEVIDFMSQILQVSCATVRFYSR